MTGEIIGAKLVLGIEAFFLEILGPLFQPLPVKTGEVRIPFHFRDRSHQEQQIAGLFDGHLVPRRALAAAVNLAVGVRIGAEVVRRERKIPALARGVIHERHEKRFGHGRSEQQELRRHGIKDIRRSNAAIGMILLAELQRLAIGIRDKFARGEALAIGERRELRVLLATGLDEIGHQFAVERFAAFPQRFVVVGGRPEQIGRLPAVATPVGPQILFHVLDRVEVVVRQH